MSRFYPTGGGGSGTGSSDCSATAGDVLSGKTYIGADTNDDVGTGTLALTGNATQSNVLSGKTFYSNNAKAKLTGTMPNLTTSTPIDHDANNSTPVVAGDDCFIGNNTDGVTRLSVRNTQTGYVTGNTLFGVSVTRVAQVAALSAGILKSGLTVLGVKGTFTSDANAPANRICSGYTAYVNGNKVTGTMSVSSVVSFSAATYSATQITITWKWPSKGPYSGIAICGKTGGYPSNINDSRVYTGTGSNYNLGATTSTIIGGLSPGQTYYFRAWVYCTTSAGDLYSGQVQATAATTSRGQQTFTSSGTFTVPSGVRSVDVFCVGGGGMGSTGYSYDRTGGAGGNGGSGGYTYTAKGVSVTPGQQVAVIVGAGATRSSTGGPDGSKSQSAGRGSDSSFGGNYIGRGGWSGGNRSSSNRRDGNGGSGGSGGATSGTSRNEYNGGSDGGDGEGGRESASFDTIWNGNTTQTWCYAYGQGSTTRAFGESSGAIYSGGGGAGAWRNSGSSDGTSNTGGGSGGGGAGGYNAVGVAGSNGTGGGGGGGGVRYGVDLYSGGYGGSGCVIVRWGY